MLQSACTRKSPVALEERREHRRNQFRDRFRFAIDSLIGRGIVGERAIELRTEENCHLHPSAVGQPFELDRGAQTPRTMISNTIRIWPISSLVGVIVGSGVSQRAHRSSRKVPIDESKRRRRFAARRCTLSEFSDAID